MTADSLSRGCADTGVRKTTRSARVARILFIDAQSADSAALAKQIQTLGYELHRAPSTADLPPLQAIDARPDLVILEVESGEALRSLERAWQYHSAGGVPVLLLLSGDELSPAAFAEQAYAFSCLPKPCRPHSMRLGIELALARHRHRVQPGWTEEGYRDFVESSHDLICTHDSRGALLSVNVAAEKALGYGRDELIGRNLADLLAPEVRHLFTAYLAEIAAKGTASGVMRMLASDGNAREWAYHNTLHRMPDGRHWVSGIAHDVTEQLTMTRQLRVSERRFRALFEQAAVGVAHIETQTGRILGANRKCGSILGYEADELTTLDFGQVVHADDRAADREAMARLERSEVSEFTAERRLVRKDGGIVWVALSVSPMWRSGSSPTEHMAVMHDISERKRAEAQREALESQLRHAQKLEAIGTLAGGIAHDFNNLLAVIRGNLELVRLDLDAQHPAASSVEAISAATSRAAELVRQILTFSRKQLSKRVPMYLGPVIEEAVTMLRAALPANILIETRLDAVAPAVLADATQIHQIVMNLCTNAWHAIEPSAGRIGLSLDAVMVSTLPPGEESVRPGRFVRMTVQDDGMGMDRETLERIFEPFFTTKGVGRGSGLGLSVAHGIVKEHGGMITVESRPRFGTTFHVYLPAADGSVNVAAPGRVALAQPGKPGGQPRGRILYVDDEQAVVSFVKRLIERLGYEAETYLHAREALAAIRSQPGRFDAVLTDYNMPEMSGADLAREVFATCPGLPIVLVSGYAEQLDERLTNLANLGIRHRLNKPFDWAELSELLERIVPRPAEPGGSTGDGGN